ncbi:MULTISPECIES: bifunctional 5,10-methylenetetrahydrofolate dehydrogenase/5,10-methenyltetrahydrofolate cyclohydrolase [Dehalobacter]|jgi:methylenetetrahydrofolate dehydrogenase (NADP+)/methenyltetrahydrofolate cyclohydrolase|uniref:Bifunctional protein FolD n=2 Tax=Dehalobacter restrictus TaxID=55583 RepID=A0A857DF67_9FIRM|nr:MULTISPECIES: bifunctional 5,10-methylenetetrahydrofolate dehydrogenase/5,10-methenyltetrahydrofolate cyclohydrolase [Dehalobacter]AHF08842.1 methenyltetrahydrofolate cyclohydrolase [Dehalobacter restrictus DSM 9455]MCG1024137.1 bifunctional 5,10-methylenetetrahydrofolate dehydrogenase/5,10-methenyltetrahydrofolate cyclohydrolase [Dehalobacter sp.]MDJ0305419.1 bifunctional 5,10-methylenetetrahydrofolate dehydrogenase/5,10-methenyltetrahydrofolate cyclohydrolase [Dehalobacter sp.]OCZ50018.1 b
MTQILNAKPVVQAMKENLQQEVAALKAEGINPTLGIIRVGSRPDDVYYENSIIKNCDNLGIATKTYPLDLNISMEEFTKVMTGVNNDSTVHGIMLFRPLPKQLDEEVIKHLISADKDIDCMNPLNLAKVFEGDMSGLLPCTPAACMETLSHYGYNLSGANVVVMGRSLVVGKPLAMMLLKENATVTMCHSKTKDMAGIAKKADIIIAAMGRAKMIDDKYVSENTVVIDVGINDAGDGKMCGDVDYDAVVNKVSAITPVPGGVGSITTAILMKNCLRAARKKHW